MHRIGLKIKIIIKISVKELQFINNYIYIKRKPKIKFKKLKVKLILC